MYLHVRTIYVVYNFTHAYLLCYAFCVVFCVVIFLLISKFLVLCWKKTFRFIYYLMLSVMKTNKNMMSYR